MTWFSTKTYGPDRGFSCAFRQWKAESHCKYVHGYSLGFKFVFGANDLDARNWVVDFGGLKSLKDILEENFDHKTIVASDDPEVEWFREANKRGILQLVEFPAVGCERIAQYVFEVTEQWLHDAGYGGRCWIESVEVSEHGANSAIYSNYQTGAL